MTVDDFAVTAGQDGNLETKFPDAAAHAIHGSIVLARVAGVENEFVYWPQFDTLRHDLRNHASPHQEFSLY
jgi:hypothetical protein